MVSPPSSLDVPALSDDWLIRPWPRLSSSRRAFLGSADSLIPGCTVIYAVAGQDGAVPSS